MRGWIRLLMLSPDAVLLAIILLLLICVVQGNQGSANLLWSARYPHQWMSLRHRLCMLKVRCCLTHLVTDLVRLGWVPRPGFTAEREQPAAAQPEAEESGNHTTWAEVQEAMATSEAAGPDRSALVDQP